jgi:hypothetical protein
MPLKHLNDEVVASSELLLHCGMPLLTATVQTRD